MVVSIDGGSPMAGWFTWNIPATKMDDSWGSPTLGSLGNHHSYNGLMDLSIFSLQESTVANWKIINVGFSSKTCLIALQGLGSSQKTAPVENGRQNPIIFTGFQPSFWWCRILQPSAVCTNFSEIPFFAKPTCASR